MYGLKCLLANAGNWSLNHGESVNDNARIWPFKLFAMHTHITDMATLLVLFLSFFQSIKNAF